MSMTTEEAVELIQTETEELKLALKTAAKHHQTVKRTGQVDTFARDAATSVVPGAENKEETCKHDYKVLVALGRRVGAVSNELTKRQVQATTDKSEATHDGERPQS